IQGAWKAIELRQDNKPVRDEKALRAFDWVVVGEQLITQRDGRLRVGSIQVVTKDGAREIRFTFDKSGAEPHVGKAELTGKQLKVTVVPGLAVPGGAAAKETVLTLERQ